MLGNLQMNNYRITGLTNPPGGDDEAVNKKYVDENISKSNIKPSHTPKNVFQYLMDDVNEWSTEYNVKVESINDLPESPHSWDNKKPYGFIDGPFIPQDTQSKKSEYIESA